MVSSINFVVLGDYSVAAELGKKGTTTDIAIYDSKSSDLIYTFTTPIGFPEKIKSLMQAVNLAEYAILNVTKMDKYLGEQIVALDYVGFREGLLLHAYDIDETKLRDLTKDTTLSEFRLVKGEDVLKKEISKFQPKHVEGSVMIPIDHVFDVKGVGTVVLGVIRSGTVHVHDELKILPGGKNVLVKSIQMHDDSVTEATSPARVGLAIKGIGADQISRGDIMCMADDRDIKVTSDEISLKFAKNTFFKGELTENQTYLASIGLQVKPVKIKKDGVTLKMKPETPIAYIQEQSCVLLKPDATGIRIIGKGIL